MTEIFTPDEIAYLKKEIGLRYARMAPEAITTMLVSQWAESKRILPRGISNRYGPMRLSKPMIEIVDCLAESSSVREVAFMKGAQIEATTSITENFMGYIIDIAPGPTLAITGDKDMAEIWMEKRIDPMLQSAGIMDKIFAQVKKKHGHSTGNTKDAKEFVGGFLLMFGPNSSAKLQSNSIQYLLLEEEDTYPAQLKGVGDMIANAIRRTDSYEDTRKILHISTPREATNSRIQAAFLKGDQRYFYVPCKKCGHMQILKWDRVKYETNDKGLLVWDYDEAGEVIPGSAHVWYECENPDCREQWGNDDKAIFIPSGEWRATAKASKAFCRSYHLSSLYSPIGARSWGSIVEEWIDCKGDVLKLQTFMNTVLGEPWEDRGASPDHARIMIRRDAEPYTSGTLPPSFDPLVITLGSDVQEDRIECEIVAWSLAKLSASVSYHVLEGDTSDLQGRAWQGLREILDNEHAGFPIALALIDAGFRTSTVYQFCEAYSSGVLPCMGDPTTAAARRYFAVRDVPGYATQRVDISTAHLKGELYGYLQRGYPAEGAEFPPGYCHFPTDYTETHFLQLTSEKRVPEKMRNGGTKYVWKLPGGRRNEVLDCRVYAMAALYVLAGQVSEEVSPDEPISWERFWTMLLAQAA